MMPPGQELATRGAGNSRRVWRMRGQRPLAADTGFLPTCSVRRIQPSVIENAPDRAGPVSIVGEIVGLFTKYPVQTNDRCADGVELGGQLAAPVNYDSIPPAKAEVRMFVGLASNDWVELMGKIQVLLTDDH